MKNKTLWHCSILFTALLGICSFLSFPLRAAEPPTINPFQKPPAQREDVLPGCLELSDGKILAGQIYLTRDKRLIIYDEEKQRQREVPLNVVKQIDCKIKKEWMEKEWKFKELTKDEKMYTGRQYPTREYIHTVTLADGRKITGPISGIIYVQPTGYSPDKNQPQHFLLHKRDKGQSGQKLKDLLYVKTIILGKEAMEEGRKKIENQSKVKGKAAQPTLKKTPR
jgi:hypothetical protein